MSAVLALLAADAAPLPPPAVAARMLAAMAGRGAEAEAVVRHGGALLGVARHGWELADGFAGPALVARDRESFVAADATLYYRDDLVRALAARGVEPAGATAGHLILAAYRAWGEECAAHLEGDFAFALWDATRGVALFARDFGGKRPLYWAEPAGGFAAASSVAALLAHPRISGECDLVAVAEDAVGLTGSPTATGYREVFSLPAGHILRWEAGRGARCRRFWDPPAFAEEAELPFDEAAEALRELLAGAVRERLDPAGTTGIWLSGGWDSPAVFATGRRLLEGGGGTLAPVSVSFPPGDPGREDELIAAIAGRWGAEPSWLPIHRIPAFDATPAASAARDDPAPHPFDLVNRAMATESRAAGARVVLDGNGGDQLFQLSNVHLADLFRAGRWGTLRREWRAEGGGGARAFLRDAVRPALPPAAERLVAWVRGGRAPASGVSQSPAEWLAAPFSKAHALTEREAAHTVLPPGPSLAARLSAWYLVRSLFPRMSACVARAALECGVEHRSPLLDERVVRFAAARPVRERRSGGETKRLLRAAMRGLLPDEVLAPRADRTGVPILYLLRSLRDTLRIHPELARVATLAEAGIVDPAAFARGCEAFTRGDHRAGVALFFTLHAEAWLRARVGPGDPTEAPATAAARDLRCATTPAAHMPV